MVFAHAVVTQAKGIVSHEHPIAEMIRRFRLGSYTLDSTVVTKAAGFTM
jgi:hypothetical protein